MRPDLSHLEIVPASALGDPSRLRPLAERIFGLGDRPAGWFARKLARERIDPELSVVALAEGRPYGYALVGTPFDTLARTAGVGVAPEARGRGIGSRLLRAAAARAKSGGFFRLRSLAEPTRVSFYERLGFVACRTNHSLLNFSTGARRPLGPPAAWDDVGACIHEIAAWMPEAWIHTPRETRATLRIDDDAVVHLSREGKALLVHRLTTRTRTDAHVVSVAAALCARIPAGQPVLLYGCNAVSSITSSLVREGWSVVQTAVVMECPL